MLVTLRHLRPRAMSNKPSLEAGLTILELAKVIVCFFLWWLCQGILAAFEFLKENGYTRIGADGAARLVFSAIGFLVGVGAIFSASYSWANMAQVLTVVYFFLFVLSSFIDRDKPFLDRLLPRALWFFFA